MRRYTLFALLAATAWSTAQAGTNIGVSIDISQPGVYGRIDIGNVSAPAVVYAQPVVVTPTPVAVYQRPIYLYVPPAHRTHWGRHCGRYAACGQPVYFVRDDWIQYRHALAHDDHGRKDRGAPPGRKPGRGHKHDD